MILQSTVCPVGTFMGSKQNLQLMLQLLIFAISVNGSRIR